MCSGTWNARSLKGRRTITRDHTTDSHQSTRVTQVDRLTTLLHRTTTDLWPSSLSATTLVGKLSVWKQ